MAITNGYEKNPTELHLALLFWLTVGLSTAPKFLKHAIRGLTFYRSSDRALHEMRTWPLHSAWRFRQKSQARNTHFTGEISDRACLHSCLSNLEDLGSFSPIVKCLMFYLLLSHVVLKWMASEIGFDYSIVLNLNVLWFRTLDHFSAFSIIFGSNKWDHLWEQYGTMVTCYHFFSWATSPLGDETWQTILRCWCHFCWWALWHQW